MATSVAMVNVVVTALPFGVTVEGEKLQELASGSPEQAKLTDWSKPLSGVTVTVVLPDWPAFRVTVAGFRPNAKPGPFTVCVSTAEVDPAKLASPP